MANFKTHLLGAVIAGGVMTWAAAGTELLTPIQLLVVGSLCAFGGLLPDVDSDHSVPVRWLCGCVALVVGIGLGLSSIWEPLAEYLRNYLELQLNQRSTAVLEVGLAVVMSAVVALVGQRLLLWAVRRSTTHRGVIHSLPAAALLGLVTTGAMIHILGYGRGFSWLAGIALALGFVIHLVLDECASVDLSGRRLKRSFGTALKLGSANNILGTLVLYLGVAWLVHQAPPSAPGLERLVSPQRWVDTGARAWTYMRENIDKR